MLKENVTIVNKTGLHARPAYRFVEVAQEFKSDIYINENGKTHNAKSIIDILGSCIACGTKIELCTNGTDEREALITLVEEIKAGLGEE